MKVKCSFRVERCHGRGTRPCPTAYRWAIVDPRDGSHAAHDRTKNAARDSARRFRRIREEMEKEAVVPAQVPGPGSPE